MKVRLGNAPCSWGVEFANDPRNPNWKTVLKECSDAGYSGIELGPVGFMPEDPIELSEALDERDLQLIGGVVFRAFHDPNQWEDVLDGALRTCKSLEAHKAQHLVLIDSISELRAPTAGRSAEAIQMDSSEWKKFRERFKEIAKMGADYGLTVGIHAHAGGFMDFEPELERLLEECPEDLLKICFDTGHHSYAGFDPIRFMEKWIKRISYIHFKDINPIIKAEVISKRTGFYEACGRGIFCNLGEGDVDFTAVKKILEKNNYQGWCTVEQDCDPKLDVQPADDALSNRQFLLRLGF